MVEVELDYQDEWDKERNWQALAERAVAGAFAVSGFSTNPRISVSICLSTNNEVQDLNAQWRSKDKPTNVLSFPMLEPDELSTLDTTDKGEVLLGDIILAHGVCAEEAKERGISLSQHVIHLIIHGTLHLLGYNHIEDAEAEIMEGLEVKALASLGLANPYSAN
jgi:probable rRNA maturation factor